MLEEQVKLLLEKDYEGNTSLEEERELRKLLPGVSGYELEKQFFLSMETVKSLEPGKKPPPGTRRETSPWLKMAAVMSIFLGLSWLFVNHQQKQAEERAFTQ